MKHKILFYQWHSFMNRGIEKAFQTLGIEYDILFFQQTDWEMDSGLAELLERKLAGANYAMVFSVNFAPIVSRVCEGKQILYVSWVYDAPIHIRNPEPLKNSCNRIFFFDRKQAESYRRIGVNAFHMPLAADIDTFGRKSGVYKTDISMVGKLYQTEYSYYCTPLDDYQKGYLDALISAQMKVYGGYFLDELIDDKLLAGLNEKYRTASGGTVSVSREELEYMLACEITGRERYLILALLSRHFKVELYSTDQDERLKQVTHRGYADYYSQMPDVFRASRINLNVSLKLIKSGVPLRVFDILACGGFLITNYQEELYELFVPGEDFVVYESIEDLFEKAVFYMEHDAERERIARHGYETVSQRYTFPIQIEKICREAER